MAARTEIHRARITLSDTDHGHYQTIETTLGLHPSETCQRLVTRLLAFVLCHEDGLSFTKGVCTGDEPDIWTHDATGALSHWIEVGLPEAARLLKAARHCPRVSLFLQGPRRTAWRDEQLARLVAHGGIDVWSLDENLIEVLSQSIKRSIDWVITLSDGHLYMDYGTGQVDSILEHLAGPQRLRP